MQEAEMRAWAARWAAPCEEITGWAGYGLIADIFTAKGYCLITSTMPSSEETKHTVTGGSLYWDAAMDSTEGDEALVAESDAYADPAMAAIELAYKAFAFIHPCGEGEPKGEGVARA